MNYVSLREHSIEQDTIGPNYSHDRDFVSKGRSRDNVLSPPPASIHISSVFKAPPEPILGQRLLSIPSTVARVAQSRDAKLPQSTT